MASEHVGRRKRTKSICICNTPARLLNAAIVCFVSGRLVDWNCFADPPPPRSRTRAPSQLYAPDLLPDLALGPLRTVACHANARIDAGLAMATGSGRHHQKRKATGCLMRVESRVTRVIRGA